VEEKKGVHLRKRGTRASTSMHERETKRKDGGRRAEQVEE